MITAIRVFNLILLLTFPTNLQSKRHGSSSILISFYFVCEMFVSISFVSTNQRFKRLIRWPVWKLSGFNNKKVKLIIFIPYQQPKFNVKNLIYLYVNKIKYLREFMW